MKDLNKILSILSVAGMLTVFRHAPETWKIDPLSTLIVGINIIGACAWLLFDAFGRK